LTTSVHARGGDRGKSPRPVEADSRAARRGCQADQVSWAAARWTGPRLTGAAGLAAPAERQERASRHDRQRARGRNDRQVKDRRLIALIEAADVAEDHARTPL